MVERDRLVQAKDEPERTVYVANRGVDLGCVSSLLSKTLISDSLQLEI